MKIVNNIPKNAHIIDTKWVFTKKENNKRKARLVARGFQQVPGEDFIETYSPTIQADSLRLTVAIAAINNWKLRQMDIKAAYLNAELEEKIYIKIPEGDKNYKDKNKFWLLKKALYGLKQASRMWYKEISNFLISIAYKRYQTDYCLFGKYNKNNKLISLLTLYVDDILITGYDKEINYTCDFIKNKYKISKDTEANKIIGINIYKTKNGYKINQIDYINKIINKYNMNKTKEIKTPCRKISLKEQENSSPVNVKEYKSLLGALLYIAIKSRPDIAFAVNQASRFCENPTEVDYKALLQILQYLKGTKTNSIYYNRNNNFRGYSDSDFANDEKTRRSTSGYIFMLGESPISWKSQLQKIVTLSTAEAEYVSLTECVKQGMRFRNLFKEMINKDIKIKIMVDNKACIAIAQDTNSKGRCKHIDTRYKFIQEDIVNNKIVLEYINTEDMLADPLTKSIPGIKMTKFTDLIFKEK